MSDDSPSVQMGITMTVNEWTSIADILAEHDEHREFAQSIYDHLIRVVSGQGGGGVQ